MQISILNTLVSQLTILKYSYNMAQKIYLPKLKLKILTIIETHLIQENNNFL